MKITIKPGLEIGDDCPPFIIAEVGSNWRTPEDCLLSIEKAKECGADAVKFQLYTGLALYGRSFGNVGDRLSGCLPIGWLNFLRAHCDTIGIEFMCSAFSPELIDAVNPYVNIHKLASAEMCHVRMLEKLREIDKPVLMSTGGHTVAEITKAISYLDTLNYPPEVVLMYCVAAYPAQEVNLDTIRVLRNQFGTLVGYSDHTLDVLEIPRRSVSLGACVVEKHFTAIDGATPDSSHSLRPDQFKRMVDSFRKILMAEVGPTAAEAPMILRHNRRLIATKDIQEGHTFREGHTFGIYRALQDTPHALSPFEIGRVEGKTAKRTIQAGEGIEERDL